MAGLTSEEVDVIKRCWSVAGQNIHTAGEVTFYKFFEKHPEYVALFPKFHRTPLAQLKHNVSFRNHAFLIMAQFGKSVALLGQPGGNDEIKRLWYEHGILHIPLKVTRKQFNEFKDIFIQVVLEMCNLQFIPEVKAAWEKFISIMYSYSFEKSGAE